ncbi:Glycosyl transferase, group 1 family protein [Serratia proteamaculans]|uniref:glycosyltransferase family 4 protein n=1 Tax=Serratia proteamaculans TaxID=28151 RepID=UPI0009F7C786|nr:glycosyltransferase family 4 protein [Serratia proteamaculans]SMB29432.1 Glycosyl transferase, group 1 family protein [Serratia proteamaculans]
MIKVLVFLGYRHAYNADAWRNRYKNGLANDSMVYGYENYKDKKIEVNYFRFNKLERIIFKNKKIGMLYTYFIKLPLSLFFYDSVWTHFDKDGLYIAALKKIPILNKLMPTLVANFVWTIDALFSMSEKKIKIYKWLVSDIEKIVYHSEAETTHFKNTLGCKDNHIKKIHYGINFQSFNNSALEMCPVGFNAKRFILMVGTDIHRDLELFKWLVTQHANLSFVLCSNNPDFLNMKFETNNVEVLSADFNEMIYLYRRCMLVVIPLKDNLHVSGLTTLLESAAVKKPIVLTFTPGFEDYCLPGETCLTADVGDYAGFDAQVCRIINDEVFARYLSERSHEFCLEKFTTHNWAKEHCLLTMELNGAEK